MTTPVVAGDRCFVNAYQIRRSEFGMPSYEPAFDELLAEHDANGNGFVDKSEWQDENIQMAWSSSTSTTTIVSMRTSGTS